MSTISKHSRLFLVAICCLAVGAGASAIAGAGAATSSSAHPSGAKAGRLAHRQGLLRLARRTVSGQLVVRTKQGFATATLERGVVDSVSGQQLKLTEGTPKATYKTVTLTIPADAHVRDDHQKASLSAVKPGQRVLVIQAPQRTIVVAHTPHAASTG
ncbi:MAG: hypothetical protein ACR2NR_14825 [Solirubrobacteraceae bacterium]